MLPGFIFISWTMLVAVGPIPRAQGLWREEGALMAGGRWLDQRTWNAPRYLTPVPVQWLGPQE
jgi:hypothetical protein